MRLNLTFHAFKLFGKRKRGVCVWGGGRKGGGGGLGVELDCSRLGSGGGGGAFVL